MASIFDGLASTIVQVLGDDELAQYTLADGSQSAAVQVIFEAPARSMAVHGLSSGVAAIEIPTKFHANTADLPAGFGQGDTLQFRGRQWTVKAALPDGHGIVALEVEAA